MARGMGEEAITNPVFRVEVTHGHSLHTGNGLNGGSPFQILYPDDGSWDLVETVKKETVP